MLSLQDNRNMSAGSDAVLAPTFTESLRRNFGTRCLGRRAGVRTDLGRVQGDVLRIAGSSDSADVGGAVAVGLSGRVEERSEYVASEVPLRRVRDKDPRRPVVVA